MIILNLINPTQAYQAINNVWLKVKSELQAGNKQVIELKSYEEALTAKQRKYYHGYILTTIAQSVSVDGRKYHLNVWKEHYRRLFLPDAIVDITDIKTGATRRELHRVSSESLSVKGYTKLIEQVTADAASEYGVIFDADFDTWLEGNK
jgi:predicted GNAT superfamily acetyltransferase